MRVLARFTSLIFVALISIGPTLAQSPAQGETRRVKPKGAMVYIVWPKFFLELPLPDSLKADWRFYIDGKFVGKMTSGDYLAIPVTPGNRTLSYDNQNLLNSVFGMPKQKADVSAGGARYFAIIYENAGPYVLPFLRVTTADAAKKAMRVLRRR